MSPLLDLIDKTSSPSCNETCAENVVVENCDDLIAQENEEVKPEVERFLRRIKGKSIFHEYKKQPPLDNRPKMMKKLEKGATVTCNLRHQGHKSYESKNKKKGK